jgi:hypothetical protein
MFEFKKTIKKSLEHGMTRRKFLSEAANAVAIAGVVNVIPAIHSGNEGAEHISEVQESAKEFSNQYNALRDWYNLRFDEVMLTDRDGVVVAGPIPLEDVLDADGNVVVSVGKRDAGGLLVGGISGSWLKYWRIMLGMPQDGSVLHVTKDFENFANNKDEPELVDSINNALNGGEGASRLVDVIRYFGFNPNKPVRGDDHDRTRAAYLYSEVKFGGNVPIDVQEQLRYLLIGIAGHESRFNATLTSVSGAMGILQFIQAVREEYGFEPDHKLTFKEEVDLVGRYMTNSYKRVDYWMLKRKVTSESGDMKTIDKPDTKERLRRVFDDSENNWLKYFYIPCMVNAYNAGELTIGQALHSFVDAHTDEQLREFAGNGSNYGLFYAFTKYAKIDTYDKYVSNYGSEAQKYTIGVLACADTLAGK